MEGQLEAADDDRVAGSDGGEARDLSVANFSPTLSFADLQTLYRFSTYRATDVALIPRPLPSTR